MLSVIPKGIDTATRSLRFVAGFFRHGSAAIRAYFVKALRYLKRLILYAFPIVLTGTRLTAGWLAIEACGRNNLQAAFPSFVVAGLLGTATGLKATWGQRISAVGAFLEVLADGVIVFLYMEALLRIHILPLPAFYLFLFSGILGVAAQIVHIVDKCELSPVTARAGRVSARIVYIGCMAATLATIKPTVFSRFSQLDVEWVLLGMAAASCLFMFEFLADALSDVFAKPALLSPTTLRIYAKEPVASYLIDTLNLRPLTIFNFYFALITVPLFLTAMATGVFFEQVRFKGVLTLYSVLIGYSLLVPATIALAVRFYGAVGPALFRLKEDHVITDAYYLDFLESCKKTFENRWYVWGTVAVVVVAEVSFRWDMTNNDVLDWMESSPGRLNLVGSIESVIHVVSAYFILATILYGGIVIAKLGPLIKGNTALQYWHPDGCAGTKPAVDLISMFMNIVILLLLELVLTVRDTIMLGEETLIHSLLCILGMITLPLVVILPLWILHQRLVFERATLLRKVHNIVLGTRTESDNGTDVPRTARSEAGKLTRAEDVQRAIDSIPVWPFPLYKALAFGGKLLVPLLGFVGAVLKLYQK